MERVRRLEENEVHSCQFCTPEMSNLNHFEERGVGRIDLTEIRNTENFTVKPDSLPVHPEGSHVLIIPREHTYGFALLPTERGEEVQKIIDDLEQTLGEEMVLFEHGGVKHGGNIQSVYHAHAHLIGSEGYDVIPYMASVLESDQIPFELIPANHNPIRNIQRNFKGEGYFYIQQDGHAIIAHDTEDNLPSQIAQRNMSRLLTGEEVNWKEMSSNPRYADLSVQRINILIERVGVYDMSVL